jgi:hypothetical protein
VVEESTIGITVLLKGKLIFEGWNKEVTEFRLTFSYKEKMISVVIRKRS